VSLRSKLRVLFVCAVLESGVLIGAPMRPEEIEELMHQMNHSAVAHVLPFESDEGDDRFT
jgi:hypothetical protein